MKVTTKRFSGERRERRGGALVYVTVFIGVLSSMAFSLMMTSMGSMREQRGAREEANAVFLAQAAISEAFFDLENGGDGQLGAANDRRFYGGGSFWVDAIEVGGIRTLLATCEAGNSEAQVELTLRETSTNLFSWAAFGDESLEISSNAQVDSYLSNAGTYDSQEVNGSGSSTYANPNGDVGSNGSILLRQNGWVWGSSAAGPGYSTTVVGSNAGVSGTTTPNVAIVDLPAIEVPSFPSAGPLTVPNHGTRTIGPGDLAFDDLYVGTGGELWVIGPATVVVDNFEIRKNTELFVDASAGPVEFFVVNDFIMSSNTEIRSLTSSPLDIAFNLLSDNVIDPDMEVELDEVDFESNAKLYGTVYAPNAAIEINSNFELFGSIVARSLLLDSNTRIHYDELLSTLATDAVVTYEVLAQRVLK